MFIISLNSEFSEERVLKSLKEFLLSWEMLFSFFHIPDLLSKEQADKEAVNRMIHASLIFTITYLKYLGQVVLILNQSLLFQKVICSPPLYPKSLTSIKLF